MAAFLLDLFPSSGSAVPVVQPLVLGPLPGEAVPSSATSKFPLSPGSPETGQVYQVEGYTVGGGDTVLTSSAPPGTFKLSVGSVVNFSIGDWCEIYEAGVGKEFFQIEDIQGSVLVADYALVSGSFTTSATVKEVDVTLKYENDDWTVNRTTGVVTLLSGRFTAGKNVFMRYSQVITDLGGYEAYRIPGDLPLGDRAHYLEVTGHGSVVTVDNALGSGATSVSEILAVTEGGKTLTYYLFSKDLEGNYSRAQAVMVETITSRVTGFGKTVGPGEVTLFWDPVSETNFDGVNVYRCSGSWDPAAAVQVNSSLITGTSFLDGIGNSTNRRPVGEVPYPVSGTTYYYVVETEDTASAWTTGRQNQSLDPLKSEVATATKTDV